MKKEIKVVAVVLVALVVFLAGFGLGSTKGININVKYEGSAATQVAGTVAPDTTVPTTVTTTVPTTVTTTTSVIEGAVSDVGDAVSGAIDNVVSNAADAVTDAINAAQTPSTPAEIAAAYNKAINEYRAYTGTVTTKKVETIDIQVTELPAMVASVVNKVVEGFTGTTENEWTFTNGVDPDGRVPADKIIPGDREAAVDPAGLVSATATPNTDGGYTMTIKFVGEKSTFDGTKNTSEPTYHMGAMDPLNLGSLDLGPISITEADLSYPGAETTATVDAQGRLVSLHNYLPLEGYGTGGVLGMTLTINMGGSMTTDWTMTYAD